MARRKFKFLTVIDVLERLEQAGVGISRGTFYALEKKGLWQSHKTIGGWRTYNPTDMDLIIRLVKENYGLIESAEDVTLPNAYGHNTRT